jgi:hypothetical protein
MNREKKVLKELAYRDFGNRVFKSLEDRRLGISMVKTLKQI